MGEEREPRVPEHGFWSSRPDDAAEGEPRAAGEAVTTDVPGASERGEASGPSEASGQGPQNPPEPQDLQGAPIATPKPPRAPTAALGWVALGLAALCVIADVVAVVLAVQRYWVSATLIAEGTNLATAIVFVVALFAAWRRPARWLGIIAMIVAILANPFILSHLLAFLGG